MSVKEKAKENWIPVSSAVLIIGACAGMYERVGSKMDSAVQQSMEKDAEWKREDALWKQQKDLRDEMLATRVQGCEAAIKTPSPWDWRRSDQRSYMQRFSEMNDGLRVPPVPEADWPRWESASGN